MKGISINFVSMRTLNALGECEFMLREDKDWLRTKSEPCSSNIRERIMAASHTFAMALLCSPSTFWVISRDIIDLYCSAASAKCDVLGRASRTGGYPKYERSLFLTVNSRSSPYLVEHSPISLPFQSFSSQLDPQHRSS